MKTIAQARCKAADGGTARRPAAIRKDLMKRQAVPAAWFEKSDRYGIWITARILLPFFAALAAAPVAWTLVSPLAVLPLAVLIGVYGYKISFIMHDCAHDTLFRSRRLNDVAGGLCGWIVVSHYPSFKRIHALHHRHNGTLRDPQYGEANDFQGASSGRMVWHLTNALLGQRLLGYFAGYLGSGRSNAGQGSQQKADEAAEPRPASKLPWLIATAGSQLGVLVLVTGFGSVPALALLYPLSGATVSLCLARLRTFAEHVLPPAGEFNDFTRSHRPNWLDAFFLYDAHFNYHLEHHLFPHMPSCHLPKLFDANQDQIHGELTLGRSMFATITRRVAAGQAG